jgi:hypothetical protein
MTIPRKHILEHLEMHGFSDFIIIAIRQNNERVDELLPGKIEVFSTLTDDGLIENIITQTSGVMKAIAITESSLLH